METSSIRNSCVKCRGENLCVYIHALIQKMMQTQYILGDGLDATWIQVPKA